MVKTYVADVKVQEILNDLSSCGDGIIPCIGIIIGQFSDQKDYILHLMKTPMINEKSKDGLNRDDDDDDEPKKSKKESSPEIVMEKSLYIHARQVRQMLTGGMEVMGLVVCSPSDEFKSSQTRYKHLLATLLKVVGKFDFLLSPQADQSDDRILLHVCSHTRRVSCKSYPTADAKHSGTPCDIKFQRLLDSFVSLGTNFSIRTTLYVNEDDVRNGLERQIVDGLAPSIGSILESIPVVDGNMFEEDGDDDDHFAKKSLESFVKNNNKGKKNEDDDYDDDAEEDEDEDDIIVDLLRNYSRDSGKDRIKVEVIRCGSKIVANGTISCKAFVHGRASLSDGVKALKRDVIRSLLTRCELVCQDLLQGEEDQDVRVVYETPVRAFASLHQSNIRLSDYLFQDETTADSLGRFKEVLGLSELNETEVCQSKELIPDAEDLEQVEHILNGKHSIFPGLDSSHLHSDSASNGSSWNDALKPFFSR